MDTKKGYALISVYDKKGVVELARALADAGYELLSTGGTYETLASAGGLTVRQVADVTGFPEILDGRVKTLHPKIHGGLLGRRSDRRHRDEMAQYGIGPIDVVVSNLYPFVETVSKDGVPLEEALENIDIGGPAMMRAAAKNFPEVVVLVDPSDYDRVGDMVRSGDVPLDERRRLAAKAYQHVAVYDTVIASYMRSGLAERDPFPEELSAGWTRARKLRYGENPHQSGALYVPPGVSAGVAGAKQLHGIEMGYINYLDADSAWRSVAGLAGTAVSVVKHANPCGLAVHEDQAEAYRRALAGDPVSAYGGIVGFNAPVTAEAAAVMKGVMFHVIVAPGYEPEALETLRRRKNARILQVGRCAESEVAYHSISGGVLAQIPDPVADDPEEWEVRSERGPSADELRDLRFGWYACAMIKSNAIVMARDSAIVGMGAGQPNRVTSVDLAARVAGDAAKGSVLASDAFFPFPDGITRAAEAGCTAVVAPGGSIRDDEVVAEANSQDMALLFAPNRHLLH